MHSQLDLIPAGRWVFLPRTVDSRLLWPNLAGRRAYLASDDRAPITNVFVDNRLMHWTIRESLPQELMYGDTWHRLRKINRLYGYLVGRTERLCV